MTTRFVLRRRATYLCYACVLRYSATPFVLRLYATPLVLSQISIQLPLPNLPDVLLPFLALRVQIPLVDVLAQRLTDHRILLQIIERFVQVPGKVVDPELASLAVRHARDVLVHRLAGIDPLVDAVQTGSELHGDREVWIGTRVGHAILAARRLAALGRHPDEGRHVLRDRKSVV